MAEAGPSTDLDTAAVTVAAPDAAQRHSGNGAATLGAGMAAALCVLAGAAIASHHPLSASAACLAFAAWAAMVYRYPDCWLTLLPAAMPLLALGPWTGWVAVDEFDFAILATAAGGYAWLAANGRAPRGGPAASPALLAARLGLSREARWILVALAVSTLVSLATGLAHVERLEFGWYDSYTTATNVLRVAKSTFGFLLILPLMKLRWQLAPSACASRLCLGMAVGVCLASLVALWERLAFAGLLDFTRYYRTSGSFVEGHVGGASFDVYLALGMPFVAWALVTATTRMGRIAAFAGVLLVVYAAISTMSRSLFVAAAVGAACGVWCIRARGSAGSGGLLWWRAGSAALIVTVMAVLAHPVFIDSGYAGVALMGIACTVSGWLGMVGNPRLPPTRAWLVGVAALCVATGWLVAFPGSGADSRLTAVLCGSASCAVAAACGAMSRRWHPVPGAGVQALLLGLACMLAGESVAIFDGSSFVSRRFDRVAIDVDARVAHWLGAVDLLRTPADWLLGRGIGRFPAEYPQASATVESPGGFVVARAGERHFARVHGPTSREELVGVFGLSQRIGAVQAGAYQAEIEARVFRTTRVVLTICERHLIYEAECTSGTALLAPGGWRTIKVGIAGEGLGRGTSRFARPAYFAIAPDELGRMVDIGRAQLTDPLGRARLANGNFSSGGARWFLTGRYYFLPWHTDNFWLELLVERGISGLAVWLPLIGYGIGSRLRADRRSTDAAPYFVAAFAALVTAGCMGSVLDAPRVAFMFQLLLGYALVARADPRA